MAIFWRIVIQKQNLGRPNWQVQRGNAMNSPFGGLGRGQLVVWPIPGEALKTTPDKLTGALCTQVSGAHHKRHKINHKPHNFHPFVAVSRFPASTTG